MSPMRNTIATAAMLGALALSAHARAAADPCKLEISGTPTVYINGRRYTGPPRYDDLRDWIDEELAR